MHYIQAYTVDKKKIYILVLFAQNFINKSFSFLLNILFIKLVKEVPL